MKKLAQWLSTIEALHPEAIKLGLERVAKVADALDLLPFACPVITVGGTNGKGSCVRFLECILSSSGYRVGAYTSPHLLAFSERVRIDEEVVTEEKLCLAFAVVEQARKGMALTFFEFTTLAALWLFKEAKLDVIILEVGLGGRLDAVNIVDADVAVITSVDLDHTEWLGDTREKIAYEKAGIFRPGKVAICGDTSPPACLLEESKRLVSRQYFLGRDFTYSVSTQTWNFHAPGVSYLNLPLPLLSLKNAVTALMAIAVLQEKITIPEGAIHQGIAVASLPGRFQRIEEPYPCILDVAHNPAAAEMLAENLLRHHTENELVAVVGMLADKDIANTIKPLTNFIKKWHFATLKVVRGARSEQLAGHLRDFAGLECYTHQDVHHAFKAAVNRLKANQKIVVFGSFYTVAEVLFLLKESNS